MICKTFGVVPDELSLRMDMFTLEWALDNVRMDYDGEAEKIKAVIVALKPWLNLELYQAEEKSKTNPTLVSSTYMDDLRRHGATGDELKKTQDDIDALNNKVANGAVATDGFSSLEDDDDGPMTVLSPTKVNTNGG